MSVAVQRAAEGHALARGVKAVDVGGQIARAARREEFEQCVGGRDLRAVGVRRLGELTGRELGRSQRGVGGRDILRSVRRRRALEHELVAVGRKAVLVIAVDAGEGEGQRIGRATHAVFDRAPEEVVEIDDAAVEIDLCRVEFDLEQRDQRGVERRDRIARSVAVRVQRLAAFRSRNKRRDRRRVRARAGEEVEPRHSAETYPVFAESALRGQHVARADRQIVDRDLAARDRIVGGVRRRVVRRRVEGDADHGRNDRDVRVDAGKRAYRAVCVADDRVFALDARVDGQRERAVKGLVGQTARIDGQLSGSDLVERLSAVDFAAVGIFVRSVDARDDAAVPDVVGVGEGHARQSERISSDRTVLVEQDVDRRARDGALFVDEGHAALRVNREVVVVEKYEPVVDAVECDHRPVERGQAGRAVIFLAQRSYDRERAVKLFGRNDEGAGIVAHSIVGVRRKLYRQRIRADVAGSARTPCPSQRQAILRGRLGAVLGVDRGLGERRRHGRGAAGHRHGDLGASEDDDKVEAVVGGPVIFSAVCDRIVADIDVLDAAYLVRLYPAAGGVDRVCVLDLDALALGVGDPHLLHGYECGIHAVIADAHRALFACCHNREVGDVADDVGRRVVDAHEHVARACVGAVIVPIGCDRLARDKAGECRRRRGRDRGRAVVGLGDRAGVESERRGRDRERGLRIGGGGHSDRGAGKSALNKEVGRRDAVGSQHAVDGRAVRKRERDDGHERGLAYADIRGVKRDRDHVARHGDDVERDPRRKDGVFGQRGGAVVGLGQLRDRQLDRFDVVDRAVALGVRLRSDGHVDAGRQLEVAHTDGGERYAVRTDVDRSRFERTVRAEEDQSLRSRSQRDDERSGRRAVISRREVDGHRHSYAFGDDHVGGGVIGLGELLGGDRHRALVGDDQPADDRDIVDLNVALRRSALDAIVAGDAARCDHIVRSVLHRQSGGVDDDARVALPFDARDAVRGVGRVGRQVAARDRGGDFLRSGGDLRARERSRAVIGLVDGSYRGGRRSDRIDRGMPRADVVAFFVRLSGRRAFGEHRDDRVGRDRVVAELFGERGRPDEIFVDKQAVNTGDLRGARRLVDAVEQRRDDGLVKCDLGRLIVFVGDGDGQDDRLIADRGTCVPLLAVSLRVECGGDEHIAAGEAGVGIIGVLRAAGDGLLDDLEHAVRRTLIELEIVVVERDGDRIFADARQLRLVRDGHRERERRDVPDLRRAARDVSVGKAVSQIQIEHDIGSRIGRAGAVFELSAVDRLFHALFCRTGRIAVDIGRDLAASYRILVDDADASDNGIDVLSCRAVDEVVDLHAAYRQHVIPCAADGVALDREQHLAVRLRHGVAVVRFADKGVFVVGAVGKAFDRELGDVVLRIGRDGVVELLLDAGDVERLGCDREFDGGLAACIFVIDLVLRRQFDTDLGGIVADRQSVVHRIRTAESGVAGIAERRIEHKLVSVDIKHGRRNFDVLSASVVDVGIAAVHDGARLGGDGLFLDRELERELAVVGRAETVRPSVVRLTAVDSDDRQSDDIGAGVAVAAAVAGDRNVDDLGDVVLVTPAAAFGSAARELVAAAIGELAADVVAPRRALQGEVFTADGLRDRDREVFALDRILIDHADAVYRLIVDIVVAREVVAFIGVGARCALVFARLQNVVGLVADLKAVDVHRHLLVFADAGVDELAAYLQLIPRQQAVDDDRCVVGRFVVEIAAAAVQHRDRGDLDLDRGDAADRGRIVLDIVVEVVGVAFDGEHGIVGTADVDRGRVEDEVLTRAGDQIVAELAEEDDALVRGDRSVVGNICEHRAVGLVAAAVVLLDNGLELYQLGRDVQARVRYIYIERSDAARQHIVVGLEVGDRHGERIAVLADIDRVAVDGIGELVGRVVGVQHISVGIGHGQRSVEQVGGCIGLCAVIDAEDVLHRVDERRLLNDDLGDDERADVQRRGIQDIVAVCRNKGDRGLVFALVPDGLRPSEQIGQRHAVVVGEHSGDHAVAVESRAARCGAGDVHCRTRERRLGIVVVVAVFHLSIVGVRPAPFDARTVGDQEGEVVQSERVGRDR